MTHDELIRIAREAARGLVDRLARATPHSKSPHRTPLVTSDMLDMLPKVRVMDAVAVYFESEPLTGGGKIEVYLERESGKLLCSRLAPPAKPNP